MPNMSYCRFHNTKNDMDDCLDALENGEIESKDEMHKAIFLLNNVLEFCEYQGIIEEYNMKALEEVVREAYREGGE